MDYENAHLLPRATAKTTNGEMNGKLSNGHATAASKTLTATLTAEKAVSSDDTKKSLVILVAIFVTSLAALSYVYMIFPELNESERQNIKIPRNIEDAKMLAKVLDRYKDMYYFEVMFGVATSYVL